MIINVIIQRDKVASILSNYVIVTVVSEHMEDHLFPRVHGYHEVIILSHLIVKKDIDAKHHSSVRGQS